MKRTILLLIFTFSAIPNTIVAQGTSQLGTPHPSPQTFTGETLFAALLEHNLSRDSRLHDFSVQRTYVVKDEVLQITTTSDAMAATEIRIYDCRDILAMPAVKEKAAAAPGGDAGGTCRLLRPHGWTSP